MCSDISKDVIIIDRYIGWISVYRAKKDGEELVETLKKYFVTFGIVRELSSDGKPQYRSMVKAQFLSDWGVEHCILSAYYPQSDLMAELGVILTKRMIRENINGDSSLRTYRILRALITHRKTPDRAIGLNHAQVIFGLAVRRFLSIKAGDLKLRTGWRINREQRELALFWRHTRKGEEYRIKMGGLGRMSLRIGSSCGPLFCTWWLN